MSLLTPVILEGANATEGSHTALFSQEILRRSSEWQELVVALTLFIWICKWNFPLVILEGANATEGSHKALFIQEIHRKSSEWQGLGVRVYSLLMSSSRPQAEGSLFMKHSLVCYLSITIEPHKLAHFFCHSTYLYLSNTTIFLKFYA